MDTARISWTGRLVAVPLLLVACSTTGPDDVEVMSETAGTEEATEQPGSGPVCDQARPSIPC